MSLQSREYIKGANDGQDGPIAPNQTIHSKDINDIIDSALWYTEGLVDISIKNDMVTASRKDGTVVSFQIPEYVKSVTFDKEKYNLTFFNFAGEEIVTFKIPSLELVEKFIADFKAFKTQYQSDKELIDKDIDTLEKDVEELKQEDESLKTEIDELKNNSDNFIGNLEKRFDILGTDTKSYIRASWTKSKVYLTISYRVKLNELPAYNLATKKDIPELPFPNKNNTINMTIFDGKTSQHQFRMSIETIFLTKIEPETKKLRNNNGEYLFDTVSFVYEY